MVAGAASLAIAGCGESTLDTDEIESEIKPSVEDQTGTKDVAISCPEDVKAEEGAEFECDLTAEGGIKAKVEVTQEDDNGNVHWKIAPP